MKYSIPNITKDKEVNNLFDWLITVFLFVFVVLVVTIALALKLVQLLFIAPFQLISCFKRSRL